MNKVLNGLNFTLAYQLEKIKAISEMKPPKNQKGVREFLGMVGYYIKIQE